MAVDNLTLNSKNLRGLLQEMRGFHGKRLEEVNAQQAQSSPIDALKKSSQAIAISEMGRQIGELYNNFKNAQAGSEALEGFRKAVTEFAGSFDNETLMSFVTTLKNTPNAEEALVTSTEVIRKGANLKSWWNGFAISERNHLGEPYLRETRSILTSSEAVQAQRETLNSLSSTLEETFRKMPSETFRNGVENLFDRLSRATSISEKNNLLTRFREANLTEKGTV